MTVVEKLEDVWASRDFPVLVEVTRRIDAGEHAPRTSEVAAALGMDEETARLAGAALQRRGLVDGAGAWGVPILRFTKVAGSAYLLTGLHPDGDDAVTRLVDALNQAAEQVDDEDDRSLLKRAASSLLGVSRDVAAGVMTAVITRGVG